jgi:hypothetical protein
MGWFGGTSLDDKRKECMKCSEDLAKMELAAKQMPTPALQPNGDQPKKTGFLGLWGGKRKSRRRRNNRKSRKSRRSKQR